MPTYEYRVKDKTGKLHKGSMTIENQEKLVEKLKKSNLTIIEIMEVVNVPKPRSAEKKEKKQGSSLNIGFDFGVKDEDLAFFTRQFATIMNAGLPLDRILSILYNQTKNVRLKRAVQQMGVSLQKGSSFTEAMREHKDIFDEMFLSMIAVGEVSGNLPETINRLANLIEKNMAVRKRIKSAMAYPIFIFVFSAFLAYVLIAVFLPNFIPMFQGVGLNIERDYPLTHVLITLSKLATNPAVIISCLILAVAGFFGFNMLIKTPGGKYFFDKLSFSIPGLSNLIRQSAISRFCRSYASLSSSGVPVLESLKLVAGSSGNVVLTKSIQRLSSEIKEGSSLSRVMTKEEVFPDLLVQMVTVGEESGTLPEMFDRTADYYEQNLDTAVTAFTSLLEPAMMVLVGLVVGIFVLGVLLPILGITSKMGA